MPIVAFYSPLGGVWRSTLTLLAATILAETRGEPVLAVDADVETPSFHAYLERSVLADLAGSYLKRRYYTLVDAIVAGEAPPREGMEVPRAPWSERVYLLPSEAYPPPPATELRNDYGLEDLEVATAARVAGIREIQSVAGLGREARARLALRLRRVMEAAARQVGGRVVLVDAGPGVETLLLSVLQAADYVVLLTRPDIVSVRRVAALLPLLVSHGALRVPLLPPYRGYPEPEEQKGARAGEWERRFHRLYMVYTHVPPRLDRAGSVKPRLEECREPGGGTHSREDGLDRVHEELRALLLPWLPEAYTRIPLVEDLLAPDKEGLQGRTHVERIHNAVKAARQQLTEGRRSGEERRARLLRVWCRAAEVATVINRWVEADADMDT